MAQQTAVEWLEKELKDRYPLMNSEPFFEQAKQMEKGQIMKAAKVILYRSTGQGDTAAEQYYKDTYHQRGDARPMDI